MTEWEPAAVRGGAPGDVWTLSRPVTRWVLASVAALVVAAMYWLAL